VPEVSKMILHSSSGSICHGRDDDDDDDEVEKRMRKRI
jgi:hypothetical protein